MLDKLLSTNIRDFNQRYQGTFGYFTRKDQRLLVQIAEVDFDNQSVTFYDRDHTNYTLHTDSDDAGFEFIAPVAAWHNTKLGPILVTRVAQRQYRRGICESNTSLRSPMRDSYEVTFENLHAIYDSKTTTAQALGSGNGCAVSKEFCLYKDRLFLFDKEIGSFKKGVLTLSDKGLFGVEVTDAFKRAGIGMEIA